MVQQDKEDKVLIVEDDGSIYSRNGRELLMEDDALRAEEEALMTGYEESDTFDEQNDDFADIWEEESW